MKKLTEKVITLVACLLVVQAYAEQVKCPRCDGTGKIIIKRELNELGRGLLAQGIPKSMLMGNDVCVESAQGVCPDCGGTGYINKPDNTGTASKLISAIEQAGRAYTGDQCNFFVGKVGELQDIPYFRDVIRNQTQANEIYGFVARAVESDGSGWRQVTSAEAQSLANDGKFVVGVAQNKEPSSDDHGHVCIVAPSADGQMSHDDNDGNGPWIRDSQHPDMSIRASYSFSSLANDPDKRANSHVVVPIWAVWNGNSN